MKRSWRILPSLAVQTGLPMVATHPVQFLHREDFNAHEVRCCIAGGYVLADPHRPKLYTEEQYLKTEEEMRALFADIPQAIDNTGGDCPTLQSGRCIAKTSAAVVSDTGRCVARRIHGAALSMRAWSVDLSFCIRTKRSEMLAARNISNAWTTSSRQSRP